MFWLLVIFLNSTPIHFEIRRKILRIQLSTLVFGIDKSFHIFLYCWYLSGKQGEIASEYSCEIT